MKETKGKGNPYHDENGRFCSAGEMGQAVERLKQAGKVEEYFQLRKEYELAQNNQVEVPREFIEQAITSGMMYETSKNPVVVQYMYERFKSGEPVRTTNYRLDVDSLDMFVEVGIFKNPATSDEVKKELIENATPALKNYILEQTRRGHFWPNQKEEVTVDQIKTLLKGEKKAEVLQKAMASELLSLKDKQELVATTEANSVYASFVHHNSEEVLADPQLAEELYNRTQALEQKMVDKPYNKNYTYLLSVLAESNNEKYLEYAASSLEESNYSSISHRLFNNEAVTKETAASVLAKGVLLSDDFRNTARLYSQHRFRYVSDHLSRREFAQFEDHLPKGVVDSFKDHEEKAFLNPERHEKFIESMKAYNAYKNGELKELRKQAVRARKEIDGDSAAEVKAKAKRVAQIHEDLVLFFNLR